MKTPTGAQPDEFEETYNLQNKATHVTKVMTDKEYIKSNIWKDNNWVIVGQPESRLIKKGFTPKIQDLAINDAQRNDYTSELLGNPYYSLVIVAWDLNTTDVDAINRINALAVNLTQNYNIRTVLFTSSPVSVAQAFSKAHHLVSEVFYVDEVPLKEMLRANPGIILLKNGTIINKWHYHSLPKYDDLVKEYLQQQ